MRSAPTSFGLSTSKGIPVRTPGSISTCGTDGQYWSSIIRTSCSTDGTVDKAAVPVSRSESSPISPSIVSASSSAVTSDSVRIRHCCTTFACSFIPDSRPTTVWVLRTSIASSTPITHRAGGLAARPRFRAQMPDRSPCRSVCCKRRQTRSAAGMCGPGRRPSSRTQSESPDPPDAPSARRHR